MGSILVPGQWLKLAPDWRAGQAQSVVGPVGCEHAGKRLAHIDAASLEPVEVRGDER